MHARPVDGESAAQTLLLKRGFRNVLLLCEHKAKRLNVFLQKLLLCKEALNVALAQPALWVQSAVVASMDLVSGACLCAAVNRASLLSFRPAFSWSSFFDVSHFLYLLMIQPTEGCGSDTH